jgi:diacylglycerol kinase (ATP)
MKKVIFIYNPMAGGQKVTSELDSIIGSFQEKEVLVQPFRLGKDNVHELLDILDGSNFDFAVISGGDGTINLIVNTFLKNSIDLPIGIIPSGTCNDFARCMNLPSSLSECIDVILNGKTAVVDAGLINGEQYFLSSCAGGSFVEVSFNTHSELKRNFGPFAYYLKGLSELRSLKSFKIKLKTDMEVIEEKVILFLVLNGKSAAGFSNIINEADISDGFMDIVLIKKCNHIDLVNLFIKVLGKDSLKDRNVTLLRTKTCKIEANNNLNLSIDGEKGGCLPIDIKFVHKVLTVFIK